MVRVPPEVHRHLAVEAAEAGVRLNRLIGAKLSRVIHCLQRQSPAIQSWTAGCLYVLLRIAARAWAARQVPRRGPRDCPGRLSSGAAAIRNRVGPSMRSVPATELIHREARP